MSDDIKGILKAGINRTLDETRDVLITQATLAGYGKRKWRVINSALEDWQLRGFLEIIKEPENASAHEVCVRMNSYIDK